MLLDQHKALKLWDGNARCVENMVKVAQMGFFSVPEDVNDVSVFHLYSKEHNPRY